MVATVRAAGDAVSEWVQEHLEGGEVVRRSLVGSSSWSSAYVYTTRQGPQYFVKLASGRSEEMFCGEALGLRAMADADSGLRIPKVFHYGSLSSVPGGRGLGGGGSFIVMEYLNLSGRASQAALGAALARMHAAQPKEGMAAAGHFGFPVDNTIGGTPQPNAWMDDWVDFLRERRLRHQLRLLGNARLTDMGERLCANLDRFFDGVQVRPSVLHGDLWSGNIAAVDGEPTVFDPAVYYGHSEAEFGMSWCAGFSDDFYRAYHAIIPKAPGFEDRRQIYLLYHYLNHANLFGSGYLSQCESILTRLTATL